MYAILQAKLKSGITKFGPPCMSDLKKLKLTHMCVKQREGEGI